MQSKTVMDNPYVQNELKPEEQLLWWGKPNLTRRLKNNTALYTNTILLGVLAIVALVLIFNSLNLLNEEIGFGDGLQSSTIFLLISCIALFAVSITRIVLFYNRIQKNVTNLRNTIYAITNQRIFVVTATSTSFAVKSHTRSDIGQIVRSETGEGWGDVSYGIPRAQQSGFRSVTVVDKFAGIPNARMVEDILIRTFKSGQQAPQQVWYPPQPQSMPVQPYPLRPQYPAQQPAQPYPPLPQQYEQPATPPLPPISQE